MNDTAPTKSNQSTYDQWAILVVWASSDNLAHLIATRILTIHLSQKALPPKSAQPAGSKKKFNLSNIQGDIV